MSETTELAAYYAAIEASARVLDVPCSRETVWPILTAYEHAIAAQPVIAFRVATGKRHVGELDCRFLMPPDDLDSAYSLAVESGLVPATDHPAGSLLAEVHERFPLDTSGIDFGVVGGFKKTWSFFPPDRLQKISDLAALPSMPPGLGENADYFSRFGLDDRVSVVGIDYRNHTMNVYFGELPDGCLSPENIRAMHRDIELPEPSERMIALGGQSFGLYATLRWDVPRIERISFSVMAPDPKDLPVRFDAKIEELVRNPPYGAPERNVVYVAMSATEGEYYKLQSYYRWQSQMTELMLLAEAEQDAAPEDAGAR
ncbi:aromatic prenyltransferase [Streptomyces profundus]|uniref:aromatic prenyltransferase n=1 Tax=Streptomyces profundus TaxID=2867410 RepID=UPI001D16E166|nr:aromatic prenyltransferase [Streptomyces sp. MA3_2.13]UED85143.1 prenyltransferase [Streptomyces sp. MA3_2.13]